MLFDGLVNAQKMILSGFNRNVLPQFAGPTVITLQKLPVPRASKTFFTSAKTWGFHVFQLAELPSALIPLHLATIGITLGLALHQ